jgi:hypothetical protein
MRHAREIIGALLAAVAICLPLAVLQVFDIAGSFSVPATVAVEHGDAPLAEVVAYAIEQQQLPQDGRYSAGLFSKSINLSDALTAKLAGTTIPLGGGASLQFPGTCRVTVDLPQRQIRFAPSATATVGGLIGRANVSGVKLNQNLTQATPLIDGLPDVVTIDLK